MKDGRLILYKWFMGERCRSYWNIHSDFGEVGLLGYLMAIAKYILAMIGCALCLLCTADTGAGGGQITRSTATRVSDKPSATEVVDKIITVTRFTTSLKVSDLEQVFNASLQLASTCNSSDSYCGYVTTEAFDHIRLTSVYVANPLRPDVAGGGALWEFPAGAQCLSLSSLMQRTQTQAEPPESIAAQSLEWSRQEEGATQFVVIRHLNQALERSYLRAWVRRGCVEKLELKLLQ